MMTTSALTPAYTSPARCHSKIKFRSRYRATRLLWKMLMQPQGRGPLDEWERLNVYECHADGATTPHFHIGRYPRALGAPPPRQFRCRLVRVVSRASAQTR
jgi:hypothetical protein